VILHHGQIRHVPPLPRGTVLPASTVLLQSTTTRVDRGGYIRFVVVVAFVFVVEDGGHRPVECQPGPMTQVAMQPVTAQRLRMDLAPGRVEGGKHEGSFFDGVIVLLATVATTTLLQRKYKVRLQHRSIIDRTCCHSFVSPVHGGQSCTAIIVPSGELESPFCKFVTPPPPIMYYVRVVLQNVRTHNSERQG
jgi:hypothetical protein